MSAKGIDPQTLKKIPIFSSLSDEELQAIIDAPENGIEQYKSKEIIVREMEVAQCMYVVLEGTVEVTLKGMDNFGREVVIATLKPGDFFGEQALADDSTVTARRKASVRCHIPAKVFRIDKKYVEIALHGEADESEDPTVTRTPKPNAEVRDLISKMRLFASLTPNELDNIGSWTEVIKVGPGDFVLKESEKGDCMYVVLDGNVEIFTLDDDGKVVILATHGRGSYFGEQALLPGSDGTRTAYARANGVARLIKVPKEYFRLVLNRDSAVAQALMKISQAQRKQREQIHKG